MSQDLTCTFTNGNGTKIFHRDGLRDGERDWHPPRAPATGVRDGVRDGERAGTRTGANRNVQTGSLAYDLDVEAGKATQYTGFILKGWKWSPAYSETGAPLFPSETRPVNVWVFNYAFGDYQNIGENILKLLVIPAERGLHVALADEALARGVDGVNAGVGSSGGDDEGEGREHAGLQHRYKY